LNHIHDDGGNCRKGTRRRSRRRRRRRRRTRRRRRRRRIRRKEYESLTVLHLQVPYIFFSFFRNKFVSIYAQGSLCSK
jgi:hypothetical protein